jgi:hypothetical protein
MAHNRSEIPHHHERRLLQRLRDVGWVKASKILATPSFIEKLVAKGWIERSIVDGHLCYRITDQGLAAKKCRSRSFRVGGRIEGKQSCPSAKPQA